MAKKEKARNIRTVLKAVRVTEEEAMQLARQAEEYQMTESGYMRRKLFYGSQQGFRQRPMKCSSG